MIQGISLAFAEALPDEMIRAMTETPEQAELAKAIMESARAAQAQTAQFNEA